MPVSEATEIELQKDLEQALRIAKKAWEGADMPLLSSPSEDDGTKVAIALLASAVFTAWKK